ICHGDATSRTVWTSLTANDIRIATSSLPKVQNQQRECVGQQIRPASAIQSTACHAHSTTMIGSDSLINTTKLNWMLQTRRSIGTRSWQEDDKGNGRYYCALEGRRGGIWAGQEVVGFLPGYITYVRLDRLCQSMQIMSDQ